RILGVLALLGALSASPTARAQEAPPATPATIAPATPPTEAAAAEEPGAVPPFEPPPAPQEAPPEKVKPKAAAYSLPWQLRPVTAATVVRSDTSFAMYENAASTGGVTVVSSLLASYRIPGTGTETPATGLAPLV